MRVLLGATGFVGGTLRRQRAFDLAVGRAEAERARGIHAAELFISAMPAEKWRADKDPVADRENLETLLELLGTVTADRVVLVSTVDVFEEPSGKDESSQAFRTAPGYGAHRRLVEAFVQQTFADPLVVRLPALFGPGLKKNYLYDLLHDNQVERISLESSFQWYPVERLAADVDRLLTTSVRLCHLVPEPIVTRDFVRRFFPAAEAKCAGQGGARYALETRHADVFGRTGPFMLSREEVLEAMGAFVAGAS